MKDHHERIRANEEFRKHKSFMSKTNSKSFMEASVSNDMSAINSQRSYEFGLRSPNKLKKLKSSTDKLELSPLKPSGKAKYLFGSPERETYDKQLDKDGECEITYKVYPVNKAYSPTKRPKFLDNSRGQNIRGK